MQWLPDDIDLTDYMHNQEMRQKIRSATDFRSEVLDRLRADPALTGERLPWKKAEKLIRFRSGELTLWTGINGHGKSLVLGQVATGLMYQGATVCIASLEMHPAETIKRMAMQAEGNGARSERFGNKYLNWSDNRLWVYDHVGDCKSDRMLAVVRYCALKLGIKHFFIDSLMKCGIGPEDYAGQKDFVDGLCALARDTGLAVHLLCHMRKGENDKAAPGKFDVKGAGEITDMVDNIVIVYRNLRKKDDSAEPDCYVQIAGQRHHPWDGSFAFWFSRDCQQYMEHEHAQPTYLDLQGLRAVA